MPDFELPADGLSGLPDSELSGLLDQANQAFDALTTQPASPQIAQSATSIADGIDAIRQEQDARANAGTALADAQARVTASRTPAPVVEAAQPEPVVETAPVVEDAAPELVTAGGQPQGGARTGSRELGGVDGPARTLNPSLSAIARHAPAVEAPRRNDPVLVASADIPGFTQGGIIDNMDALVAAMHARARTLPDGRGHGQRIPVAQLQRSFTHNMDLDSNAETIERVLTAATDPEILIAAGGWCAPSEISYDFFNVACLDGMVDLPTVGINRGGLRWPTSASFGDINALTGAVWSWNETMDIAAATGTAQSGVKPCVRVPCPAYNEARLSCDGVCVTVGNLTNDAFPELIANHLRLIEAVQAHYTNTRVINQLVAGSTAVDPTDAAGVAAPLLGALELEAVDYKLKYRMCRGDVMEAILPLWALGDIRSDLAKRTGVENMMAITDAQVAQWLDVRGIRAQFVSDYQLTAMGAASAATAWPTTINFLLFAPGTFVRGNGLTLDLGVVRDSTLNATNDYTAAWMEECYLIAKVGHESRNVAVTVDASGRTGIANITGNSA